MSAPALSTADLVGDPEPKGLASVYGADSEGRPQAKPLFHVWASSAKAAWALIANAPEYERAEVVYFARFPGSGPSKVWRDATSRAWRSK